MNKKESVWDYPRPPIVQKVNHKIQIFIDNKKIVDTDNSYRILETSHPPAYYIPKSEIDMTYFKKNNITTNCEFKGKASYYDFKSNNKEIGSICWTYEEPNKGFKQIRDALAFYPSKCDKCIVNGEIIKPQEGDFYGGWITSNIEGPFKGGIGTEGW